MVPRVGSQIFVSATPFAGYCPEVFLNSVMSGCVSKLLGSSGSVFLLDAGTVPGCEGGIVVHGQCSKYGLFDCITYVPWPHLVCMTFLVLAIEVFSNVSRLIPRYIVFWCWEWAYRDETI